MGYELCVMRMEPSAVGKSKGGDFVGERGGWLGRARVRRDPSRSKDAFRITAENKQRQEQATAKTNTEILAAPK